MKQKGFAEIVVIIAVLVLAGAAAAYYFGFDHGFEKSVKTTSSPTPASDETANWKTYTNADGPNIKYPTGWNVKTSKALSKENVVISGTEGEISIVIGDGFGGGCPERITVDTADQAKEGCKSPVDKNGVTHISFWQDAPNTTLDFGDGMISKGATIMVRAKINPSVEKNEGLILKILSTFRFE